MRIDTLRLIAFGKFTDLTLDLSAGSAGLHIILGENEAGKSTTLRAIEQLLYGIPSRTTDAFLHPMPKLRLGGTLVNADGRTLSFIRRKAQRETLRDANDQNSLGENALEPFLRQIDQATFSSMFGLNWEKLQREGQEILRGGGQIGPLLFSAGSGIGSLRKVREQLQSQADLLFVPRGQKPKINEIISQIDNLRDQIKELSRHSQERQKIDADLDNENARRASWQTKLQAAQAEHRRLTTIKNAQPLVIERQRLAEQLKSLRDVVPLPIDFRDRYRELITQEHVLDGKQQHLAHLEQQLQASLQEITIDDDLLDRSTEIEALQHEWGAMEKAAKDRIGLVAKLQELATRAAQTGPLINDTPWSRADRAVILQLGERASDLQRQQDHIEDAIRKSNLRRQRIEKDRNDLGPAIDIHSIPRLLEQAENWGNLDALIDERQSSLRTVRNKMDQSLRTIGLPNVAIDHFRAIPWPAETVAQELIDQIRQAKGLLASCAEKLEESQESLRQVSHQIEQHAREYPLPTNADLLDSRAHRDELWQTIRQDLAASRLPPPATLEEFELLLRRADRFADELRTHADQVATVVRLSIERKQRTADIARSQRKHDAQQLLVTELHQQWSNLWTPTGLPVGNVTEMLAKLRSARELETSITDYFAQQHLLDEYKQKREQFLAQITPHLKDHADPPTLFQDAVRRARQLLEKETLRATADAQFQRQWNDANEELLHLQADRTQLVAQWDNWTKEWQAALQRVGLDPQTSPLVAIEAARVQQDLAELELERTELQKRIDAIDADASQFNQRLKDWQHDSPVSVAELTRRLAAARAQDAQSKQIAQQLSRCTQERTSLAQTRLEIDARWKTLLAEAATNQPDDLPTRMNQADILRDTMKEWEHIDRQLAPLVRASTDLHLIDAAQNITADQLEEGLASAAATVEQAQNERSTLDQSIGSLRTKQQQIDGQADAAELAQTMQAKLALLEQYLQQYLRLTLAKEVLDQTIERYRQENESSLLTRAGSIFQQLTGGSFERLDVEFDDKSQPHLVGIRPGSTQPFEIKSMSEGTADQLYLAVRLAAVETYLRDHEPIPLLVDDILVNFDDDRAAATFRLLGDLSKQTQIIFFTHHPHLIQIAQQELPNDILFIHRLQPTMASTDAPPALPPTKIRGRKQGPIDA
jgi:uncharacterized protein YhaN